MHYNQIGNRPMNQDDLDYYEDIAELVVSKGWKRIQEIVDIDLKNIEAVVWQEENDRTIAKMQGHRSVLVWLRDLAKNTEADFKLLQESMQEDDDDADL